MADIQENTLDNVQPAQEKPNMYERTKELTDRLESGMADLFQSDKYMEYLKSLSQFHNYSTRNTLLIHMQNPGATRVASFKLWDEKFNRHVKKGEHGIRIFAPIMSKEKREFDKIDPDTGAPLLDANGKVVVEELESERLRFKLVPVFDVSQTYGDPLPELVENLIGDVTQYEAFLDALRATSPLPIEFEPLREGNDGYCRYGEKIGIRENMSEIQTVSAVIHEITHARLHDKTQAVVDPENAEPKTKGMKEVEAESVSYVVCQHFGIETAPNSLGYLAEYGSRDMSEFKASLDTIRKEASGLITAIDDRFKAICKERGIDLSVKTPEQAPPVPEKQPEPEFTTEQHTENIAGVDFTFEDVKPVTAEKELEASAPDEVYEITYWQMGTGTLALHYFDENSGRHGDFEELAHIYPDRSVSFTKEDLPEDVKAKISDYALTADIPNMAADIEARDTPAVAETAEILPDPSITIAERNSYGYTADDLLPLRQDRALELFDADHTIYMLHPDGTETMVFEREEIENYLDIFGIEREEWEQSAECAEQKSQNSEAVKESDLINGKVDTFAIYQLKDGEDLRYHRFASMNQLEADNLTVDRGNYNLVYTAPLPPAETLDGIYQKFNIDHPQDFTGHSLSPSDVIVFQRGGEITSHYVDNSGFAELPAFLGNEKQAEMTVIPEQAQEKPMATPVVQAKLSEMLGLDLADSKAPPPEVNGPAASKSVYRETLAHAREHGELDQYNASRNLNTECRDAIHTAINEARYDTNFYHMKDAVKDVVDKYGTERVELLLAKVIQGAEWDGRYSRKNKEWANGFEIPHGMKDVYSNTHPSLLDGFLDRLREKPSVLETLKQNEEKSRQASAPKKDTPTKNNKEMEM